LIRSDLIHAPQCTMQIMKYPTDFIRTFKFNCIFNCRLPEFCKFDLIMKLRILQILLCVPAISLFSQDWQLFPYKQIGYYQKGMQVESFIMDSVAKKGKDSILYFNAGWKPKDYDFMFYRYNTDKFDSLIIHNDTIIFKDVQIDQGYTIKDTVFFKPNSKPGDSWNFTTTKKLR
jgi:hypothetical protein